MRQRMQVVRDALLQEDAGSEEGWLAARGGAAFRDRNALLGRLADLGTLVLEEPDTDVVRGEVLRVVADVAQHLHQLGSEV